METQKVIWAKANAMWAHEPGDEVEIPAVEAKKLADGGFVKLSEPENAKAKPDSETPEKPKKK